MQIADKHKTLLVLILLKSGGLKASLEAQLDLVQQSCASVFSTNKGSLSAWLFYRVEVSFGQEPGPLLGRPLLLRTQFACYEVAREFLQLQIDNLEH